MAILENIGVAKRGIMSNKMRSFLTALGVIIGVASIIAMISIGRGAKADISDRIKALGANLLYVNPGAPQRTGRASFGADNVQSLKYEDALALRRGTSYVSGIAPEVNQQAQVKYQNKNTRTSIIGTTPSYEEVRNFKCVKGSYFAEADVRSKRRVCLLGAQVVKDLFGEGASPIGQMVKINNVSFLVIGLLEEKGSQGWRNPDDQIIIPITTAQKRVFGIDFIRTINVAAVSEDHMEQAQQEVERIIRREHKLPHYKQADFNIRSQAEFAKTMEETNRSFTFLLGGIAAISLIVGGIGIMNIMLVSVTERTKEIGLRKAVGAKRADILWQFLIESLVLSLSGGFIGIAFGIGGSRLISHFAHWRTLVSPFSIILAFVFAAAVGIAFGVYPAWKAAKLNPIEALRYE